MCKHFLAYIIFGKLIKVNMLKGLFTRTLLKKKNKKNAT